MILRLSSYAERAAILIVAVLLAAFLSYFGIRNAIAQHFVGLQTAYGFRRATELEPGDAQNWYLLGRYWQYNLDEPDNRLAIRAYKTSLSIDPQDAAAWLDLATAQELEGDSPTALSSFRNAKKSYPLSPDVAWRFGNFLLRQGETRPAFAELRRAVETDPRRGAEAFSRCIRVEPDVNKVLDLVIPPSRTIDLDIISALVAEGRTSDAITVWERLISLHLPISMTDAMPLVDALRRKLLIADAARVWGQAAQLSGLSDIASTPGSVLWDGGFESGVQGGAYAWLIPPTTRDVELRLDSQEKHSGVHSLRLTFDGRANLDFLGPCTYVPVQPSSTYEFSAWIQTRDMTANQGLRFQFRSLGPSDKSVVTMSDFRGDLPWTRIQSPWTSGTDVHEVQICIIRKPSAEDDNLIRGHAWVDDVALTPQPAEHPRP